MENGTYNLVDLADAAGVAPRTVRFYIQENLLPPPGGLGRGRHYGAEHLDRLRRIADFQRAGHSLLAIRTLLDSPHAPPPPPPAPPRPAPPAAPQLLSRVPLAPGVELTFDARLTPSPDDLRALQQFAARIFRPSH